MKMQYSAHIELPYDPELARLVEFNTSTSTSPRRVADDVKYLARILPERTKFTYYQRKNDNSSWDEISESKLIKLVSEGIGEITEIPFSPRAIKTAQ